eukprot:g14641.t1
MSNIFLDNTESDIFSDPARTRQKLGIIIGATVQSHNVKLDNLSNVNLAENKILKSTSNNNFSTLDISTHGENALNSATALLTNADLSTINSNISTINTNITTINSTITDLSNNTASDITSLSNSTTSSISGINANITTINSDISTLTTNIGTINTTITDLSSNLSTNYTTLNTDQNITGKKTIKNEFIIEQNDSGELQLHLNNGLGQNKITKLVAVQHASSSSPITLSLPSVKAGASSDQLVSLNSLQTITGKTMAYGDNTFTGFPTGDVTADSTDTFENKSMSGTDNTFSNIPYSAITGTPDVSNFITLASAGNLTNKSMEIPNNSYLLFKKADTNNTDARIYYDANDTLIIGNLLTNFITINDSNAITLNSVPTIGGVNMITRTSTDTLTNKTIDYNSNTFQNFPSGDVTASGAVELTNKTMDYNNNTFQNFPSGTNYATANNTFTGTANFQNDITINNQSAFGGTTTTLKIEGLKGGGLTSTSEDIFLTNTRTTGGGHFSIYEDTTAVLSIHDGKVGVGVDGDPDSLFHIKKSGGDVLMIIQTQNGANNLCGIEFYADDSTTSSGGSYQATRILSGFSSTTYQSGYLKFQTHHANNTTYNDTLTIKGQSVGILTSPSYNLDIGYNGSNNNGFRVTGSSRTITIQNDEINSSGGLYLNYNGGGVHYGSSGTQLSDNRIKHNEKPLSNALKIINKLKPQKYFKSFKMYDENHHYELDSNGNPITNDKFSIETGLIAQDIQQIEELSYLVKEMPDKSYTEEIDVLDENGEEVFDNSGNKQKTTKVISVPSRLSLSYNDIFVYNIKATQELHAENEKLKNKFSEMKEDVKLLKALLGVDKK